MKNALERGPLGLLFFAWAGARVAMVALDIPFDARPLGFFWQFLAPEWLEHDLARSLSILHGQPPLFNAFLGAGLTVAGEAHPTFFAVCFHALGAAATYGTFRALRIGGLSPWAAAALAAIFWCRPSALLYERWLMYTHPVACFLALAAWAAAASHRQPRALVAFGALLSIVALTRSAFHLGWAIVALLLVARAAGTTRRTLVLAMAPLLLVFGVYAKNYASHGQFTASTWLGMSLAKMSTHRLAPAEREALIREGRLSLASRVPPFAPLPRYPRALRGEVLHPEVPAASEWRQPNGPPNLHHEGYAAISQTSMEDARAAIAAHPVVYARAYGLAVQKFFTTPTQYWFLHDARMAIRPYDRAFAALSGAPDAFLAPADQAPEDFASPAYLASRMQWVWVLWALLAVGAGGVSLRAPPSAARALCVFAGITVLYLTVAANAVELGENHRFRVMIDPLILVGGASAIAGIVARIRRQRRTSTAK